MQQGATRVSQYPVRCLGGRKKVAVADNGGRGAAKAAPTLRTPAFLTQRFEPIRPDKVDVSGLEGLKIKASYGNILRCARRFFKFAGLAFRYVPDEKLNISQQLGELIEYIEKEVEKLDLEFCVTCKNWDGETTGILQGVVYRRGVELDQTIVVLYVSPAMYLSKRGAGIYKRFIKFFSDQTGISIGITDNRENFYLESFLWMEEDYYDEDDPDEREEESRRKKIVDAYLKGGEFQNLFEEINALGWQDVRKLTDDLILYCNEGAAGERELAKVMLDGIPVICSMNAHWYDFNPDDDGLPDEYGREYEGSVSGVFSSAILYSEQDGICEMLLDCINNESNAGIEVTGWNIHQWLYPKLKKEQVEDLLRCRYASRDFCNWMDDFYRVTEKFDKYGKTE